MITWKFGNSYMGNVWTGVELWMFSMMKSVVFEIYERELSNSKVMYSLCLSLWSYRCFRISQDLNVIRWTILSSKSIKSYYTSCASRSCKQVVPPILPEDLNYKNKSMEYSNISSQLSHLWFCLSFPCSKLVTVGQIIFSAQCFVVWCVPSATSV